MTSWRERLVRILRWSEQYTKTDMVYLTKGGFWLMLGHVVQIASGLALTIAFANLVPKEIFGTYQFVMSLAAVISAFTLTGMNAAIIRAVAQGAEGGLRAGFRTQLTWSTGMVFAGAALAAYYYVNGNMTLSLSFLIAGALSPFISAFNLSKSYFIGKQLFRESALFGLSRKLLPVAAVLVTILFTHDVVLITLAYFASNALSSGILYAAIVRRYRLPLTEEKEMVAYSKHLSVLGILAELAGQADKVLVFHYLGAAPVAAYVLAQMPVTHIRSMLKLALSLTFPKLSVSNFDEIRRSLPHKVRVFFLVALLAAIAYALLAPVLFGIIFPAYPESVLISQALALTLLAVPRGLYGQALTAHQKTRELYITNISHNALKIGLLVLLLPIYGMWGAVAAVLISQTWFVLVTRYFFSRASAS